MLVDVTLSSALAAVGASAVIVGAATYVVRELTSVASALAHEAKESDKADARLRAAESTMTRLEERTAQLRKELDEAKAAIGAVSTVAAKCHSRLFSNPAVPAAARSPTR